MKQVYLAATLLLCSSLGTVCAAQQDFDPPTARSAGGKCIIEGCLVHLVKDIEVPARETGLLKDILVKENDEIAANQSLARIDDQVSQRMKEQAQLKHSIAMKQYKDPNQIAMAEKEMKLTEEEYSVNLKLYRDGSKTRFEASRSLFQKQIAKLKYAAAIDEQQLAGLQAQAEMVNVQAADDSIKRHQIDSPIDGIVLEKFKDAGEWVNAGDSILRVAPLDVVHVHGAVDNRAFNPEEVINKPATVTLTRARGEQVQFDGFVLRTRLGSLGGDNFQVVIEVRNRKDPTGQQYMLRPSSGTVVTIHTDQQPRRVAKPATGDNE